MRKIHKDMIIHLDNQLAQNSFAQSLIKSKNARLLMLEAAKACVGIKEKTGRNDGELVELIQKTVGGSKGHAWCMYLVQTCIAYAEHKTGRKSPLHASGHCVTVWNKSPKEKRVKFHPLPGAIPIWNYSGTTNGHTEILLGADNKIMQNIGGNTSGSDGTGKVTREGNGCFFTQRSMQEFPKLKTKSSMKLLGFLIPF